MRMPTGPAGPSEFTRIISAQDYKPPPASTPAAPAAASPPAAPAPKSKMPIILGVVLAVILVLAVVLVFLVL
jgi:hypothetical protein